MQKRGVGHLPVCSEEGRLLGLVGLSDLVRRG
jgi:CBS domain-containing protein